MLAVGLILLILGVADDTGSLAAHASCSFGGRALKCNAAHYGGKTVSYAVREADRLQHVGIQWQVAGVSHPILGVTEANDQGHSVLFSPAGSFMVPAALILLGHA